MRASTALVFALLALPSSALAQGAGAPAPGPMAEIAKAPTATPSDPVSDDEKRLPRFPSAVDPVTSAPQPGPLPELSAPLLDTMAATLQASQSGAVVKGVVAPFFFMNDPVPVISEMRVELHGGSSGVQPWGFVVSTGYSRATSKLWRLSPVVRDEVTKKCAAVAQSDEEARVLAANALALQILPTLPAGSRLEQGDQTPDRWANMVLTAWQAMKDPAQKKKLEPLKLKLDRASKAADDKGGDCWIKAATLRRMEDAYSNGWAIRIFGGADFFPFVAGPRIKVEGSDDLQDPVPHAQAGRNVGGMAGYFPTRNFRFWLTGSYSQKRTAPTVEKMSSRWGVGADIAGNIPVGSVDADGFQPGVAVGAFGSVQTCMEKEGCDETVFGYKDPLKAMRITALGGFLDFRASAKVQLRVSVPVTVYTLVETPKGGDGGTTVVGIAPTLSLTVASWVLSPKTEF